MPDVENQLIQALPRRDRLHLLAQCKPVDLVLTQHLHESGQPTRHVYFPMGGFVSLVTATPGNPSLEVGMVGFEGMVGAQLALGVAMAPLTALVQGAGSAWRIGAAAFGRELVHSAPLRQGLDRYLYVLMTQQATAAACMRFHQVGPRLARWLLMSQDRARSDRFQLTQEFLAYMLGVRRVGVSAAAGVLQSAGLISYRRGQLTVLDRPGLQAAACSCYAADRRAYAAQIH